jgi:hypothetical protein
MEDTGYPQLLDHRPMEEGKPGQALKGPEEGKEV